MIKLLRASILILLLCSWLNSKSQHPVLEVKGFEYIWEQTPTSPRVIIPADSLANAQIRNSFAKAIQDRWKVVVPEVSLLVKPMKSLFSTTPKFNTRIKEKKTGRWYLFLQVFELERLSNVHNEISSFTELELKCRIINSADNALVFDRILTVDIYKEREPVDQILLTKIPAYPPAFVLAFDSIAKWLFQIEPVRQKTVTLKPACIFQESIKDKPLNQLLFKSDNDGIHHLDTPRFSFQTSTLYEKISSDKNKGANLGRGALTLLTGGQSYKQRSSEYRARVRFKEADSLYYCNINYAEVEIEYLQRERVNSFEGGGLNGKKVTGSGWELFTRYPDSTSMNVITVGKDTLATFSLYTTRSVPIKNNKMWDGRDKTTVTNMPPEWNNKEEKIAVAITGKLEGNSFNMKTSNETRTKEFYINNQLTAITYGKSEPVSALLFQSITTHQLKAITILSSLPYAHFYLARN